jgi:DNA-binding GntR family transcriptional regulator
VSTVRPGWDAAVPRGAELRRDRRRALRLSNEVPSVTTALAVPLPRRRTSAARRAVKVEQAYQRLKLDIMSGVYSPNERLVEAPLARVLGVGRNTLRAVLVRLQRDGLVIFEPNRGVRVRALSLEEAHDLLRVREVLEGLTAALAATRATPEQRARLGAVFSAMERALADDDLTGYSALNTQFHGYVLEVAGSPQAAALVDALHFPLVKLQFHPVLRHGRKAASLAEHRDLLRAIEARDADRAERAARSHIQHIRAALEQD